VAVLHFQRRIVEDAEGAVVKERLEINVVKTDECNKIISCAFNFCDFYPIININPIVLGKYLESFSSHAGNLCIPFFLNDFVNFLETGEYCSDSEIIGASLDVHRKSLTSYPVSLIIDDKSIDNSCVDRFGPFFKIHGGISLDDLRIRSIVVFDYDSYINLRGVLDSCGRNINISIDKYDKFIKSSNEKKRFRVEIPNLDIDKEISASSKKEAIKSVLSSEWSKYKSKKYYKRKPPEYIASTYFMDQGIMNEVVSEMSHKKTADASSAAGPDTSWTEGEPLSTKRDDYGSKFRDLPTTSWLGRRVRLRSINEIAVDNDGIIIYDKNDVIKVKKSDGNIFSLRKSDPNLFFTIDLI